MGVRPRIDAIREIDFAHESGKVVDVFRRPRYAAVGLLTAGMAYAFYALILNWRILLSTASAGDFGLLAELVPSLIAGFPATTTATSLVLTTIVSLGVGVNIGLVVFRLTEQASFGREGAGSFGGMAVAVAAPACPACATALFAGAGATSLFALLPFKGTEIKVLAVLLLAGSAVWIATQIDKKECEFC